jgi:hypothetical protein
MSLQPLRLVRVCVISLIVFNCAVPLARGQAKETITAEATVKSAGGANATAPLTVTIERFATDAEREALAAAVKQGGTAAARDLLAKRGDVGTIQVGAQRTPLKYAYARDTGSGRLITAVTAVPIAFIGAGLPDAKPKAGYDLGLVLLEVSASGPGHGELSPAAKIRVDDQGAFVTEDYNAADVVMLSKVVRK